MLYVDNRAGSEALAPLLRARGLPCTLTRLAYGDVAFMGAGPEGEPVGVGVEVKTIRDALNSLTTGRFAGHQLPGLAQSYNQVWFLIEGTWRANPKTGILEIPRGKRWVEATVGSRTFMWRDLQTWLFTMEIKGGAKVVRFSNWGEATLWLCTLYQWWQRGWEAHKSHLAFHDGTRHGTPFARTNGGMVTSMTDRALFVRPTVARMVAAQLPNIGWQKSQLLVKRFQTVESLVMATPEELKEIEGIGPKLADGIYNSLRSIK